MNRSWMISRSWWVPALVAVWAWSDRTGPRDENDPPRSSHGPALMSAEPPRMSGAGVEATPGQDEGPVAQALPRMEHRASPPAVHAAPPSTHTSPPAPQTIPEARTSPPAAVVSDGRVTVELVHSEIGDALRLLSREGGLNLVIGPDVKADVSVSLFNVPVRQALRSLVESNGFRWTECDGIVSVTKPGAEAANAAEQPPPMVTRILRPRCVSAVSLQQALQPVLTRWGRLSVLSEDSKQGYGLGTFTDETGGSGGASPQGTTFRSASRSDLVVNASGAAPIGGAQSVGPDGQPLRVIENSQVLLVTDVAEKVAEVVKLVEELDRPPRQVLIETRLVEMALTLQKRLGIDWSPEIFANGPILEHQTPLFWEADFAPGPSTAGLALGVVDFTRFTALFQAVQDDSALRILANPRLLVHNNHNAHILVGEKYPLLTSTITDQGTTTESFDSYIPVGVQLSVTPTILSDGRVSLLVHPATSALGEDVIGTTGLRVARIQTRELDTRVIVRDGDTIVLGGLISDRKSNIVRKIPGLGDIPVVDILTRQERPSEERVDLLVFMTIRVEGAGQLDEDEQEIFDRYKPRFQPSDALKDVPLHFEFPGTQFYNEPQAGGEPSGENREGHSGDAPAAPPPGNEIAAEPVSAVPARGDAHRVVRATIPTAPSLASTNAPSSPPPSIPPLKNNTPSRLDAPAASPIPPVASRAVRPGRPATSPTLAPGAKRRGSETARGGSFTVYALRGQGSTGAPPLSGTAVTADPRTAVTATIAGRGETPEAAPAVQHRSATAATGPARSTSGNHGSQTAAPTRSALEVQAVAVSPQEAKR